MGPYKINKGKYLRSPKAHPGGYIGCQVGAASAPLRCESPEVEAMLVRVVSSHTSKTRVWGFGV